MASDHTRKAYEKAYDSDFSPIVDNVPVCLCSSRGVLITAIGGIVSVGTMLYGVIQLGLRETWPELVLNLFYIACLVMMGMYFFKY